MKKTRIYFTLFICALFTLCYAQDEIAFPGAEGWGQLAKGGRGGKVIKVTNLNDDGPGSFRQAVCDPDPRIVIFEVSGTIDLRSPLIISSPYLTIAGQTAPGDGICLKTYPLLLSNTHDVIIRCIRVRPGIESGLLGSEIDGINIEKSANIIIDHCSFSWTVDETVNNWHKSENVSIQWCMISEPLNNSIHEKSAHGFAASIGGYKTSFHHNLLANAAGRNPSIAGNNQNFTVLLDIRNCVISNWGHRTCDGKPLSVNLINNYYKPGPATNKNVINQIAKIDYSEQLGFSGLWHIEGNMIEGFPELSKNNWKEGVRFDKGASEVRNRKTKPFEVAPVTTHSAEDAYKLVLKYVGCIRPNRDSNDKRIIEQIKTNKYTAGTNGIIDKVEDVGGWPVLKQTPPLIDSDNDGIPDFWEKANGLDSKNPKDASQKSKDSYFTNVEIYINSLMPNK